MNRRLILTSALALAPLPSWSQPAGPPLSPEVIEKLLKLIARMGVDTTLPAPIAAALGLGVAGQPWPDRQFTVKSDQDGALHAVSSQTAADADIVLSVSGPAAISIFRLQRSGTLVAATAYFPDTGLTANLPPGESQVGLAAEGVFWAAHVDGLIGQL